MYNVGMKRLLAIGLLLSVASAAFAQTPASADALIASATRTGMKTGKTVFVRFTASWCGWCHKMQSVLDRPDVKPIWDGPTPPSRGVVIPFPLRRSAESDEQEPPRTLH